MKKYLVLYLNQNAGKGPGMAEMFANTPPEQLKQGMALWGAWYGKNGGAIVEMGAPLDKPTNVTADGKGVSGPSWITGYTVVQAESIEQAAAIMKDHPHFHAPGSSIQILESVLMPGM